MRRVEIPEDQFNLGILSIRGQGVEQDVREATKWYRKVTQQGFCQSAIQFRRHVCKRYRCDSRLFRCLFWAQFGCRRWR